ncbi:SURF1 family protein [Marivibrio halodurans]|uniref:SURF1-like protein n=1 Tax=Marivibrio halodurans TaxID=2039722 RepID=A0A8J7V3L8_9PROT|nr:SURF1 family protein [Marivibrio halodurans]MBP5858510.1 SURF1 family protein [Marivibrio halodurans]
MAFRPKLIPTLFTLPALVVLIALGVWQLQRLGWKEDLIDKLQSRSVAEVVQLPTGSLDREAWEYRRVRVTGRFHHDEEMHLLNRSLNGNPGLHVLTPMTRTDVAGEPTILVNRGWVPFDRKDPETRPEGQLEGEVTVEGILRFPREVTGLQRVFLPENEPDNNMWYDANIGQMSTRIGADLPNYYLVDGREETPGLYPVGKQWRLDIRNDHLQYALTWFFLAGALAVIYVLYHRPKRAEEDGDGNGTEAS